MNASRSEERLLDLLVDSELGPSERREVLAWCQREPEGWRRCALAFLEAQTWGAELGGLVRGAAPVEPVVSAPHRQAWNLRSFGWPLAMAASFLLAFMLGLAIRGAPGPGAAPQLADPRPAAETDVAQGRVPLPAGAADVPEAANESAPRPDAAQERWGNVTLVVDDDEGGVAEEISLPVVESPSLDERWLGSHPSAIPADVRRALERLGHRVRQQRQLVPFDLEDGRRLIVPVDEVEVHPVGNRSYQ